VNHYGTTYQLLFFSLFTSLVCRDGSCDGNDACRLATVDYVVGPSCVDPFSCRYSQFVGVALINSCNDYQACYLANAYLAFAELIGCCNDEFQCNDRDGLEIIEQGCVSSEPSTSSVPSSSSAPSEVPSFLPSSMPSSSSAPSEIPSSSAAPSESSQPSLAPSYIPSLQVFIIRLGVIAKMKIFTTY